MTKKKTLDITELKKSYDSVHYLAEKYLRELRKQLQEIIDNTGLKLGFPIQGRVKAWASIKEKVISQNLKLPTAASNGNGNNRCLKT
jgi:ppGpp synthetase/RelA/SpoT-type nucleotidyltranferase